jgi:ABC-type Na+ efflux pump permease subunit
MAFRAPAYAKYEGPRLRRPAWVPLMAVTLKRGFRSVWVKRIIWFSGAMAFAMMVVFYVLNRLIPEWRSMTESVGEALGEDGDAFRVDARLYLNYLYAFIFPVLLPLSLLFGSELVASDLRTNALESYFSRPISPLGYVLGRTAAYAGFLLLATLVPLLMVWFSDVSTAPAAHLDVVGHVPWGAAQALILIALVLSLLVQAVATVTRSAMGTNIFMVVFFIFFQILSQSLYESTDNDNYLAVSFLSNILAVCSASLGLPRAAHDDVMAPTGLAFAVVIGLGLLCFLILWRQLRRRVLVG